MQKKIKISVETLERVQNLWRNWYDAVDSAGPFCLSATIRFLWKWGESTNFSD